MTVQAEARQRLAAFRQRRQPANDMLDSLLTIHTPGDIRAELDQLKASYDIVNQRAKGTAGWDVHYAEFVHFYNETRPMTEGILRWGCTSNGTLDNIRNRAKRLEEWKQDLRNQQVVIAEPTKVLPVEAGPGSLSEPLRLGVAGLGLLLLYKLVSR